MATVFDSVDIKGMRTTHFSQLMTYLEEREKSGWYYGNKIQFEQRHTDLKKWIGQIIGRSIEEDVVIPQK